MVINTNTIQKMSVKELNEAKKKCLAECDKELDTNGLTGKLEDLKKKSFIINKRINNLLKGN